MRSQPDLQEVTPNSLLYYNVLLQFWQAPHSKVQTVRRGQKIQKGSHNLPFTLPTSNFCVPGRVYFSLSLNKMCHYSLTISEQLSSITDTHQVSMFSYCHFTCSSQHISLISNTHVQSKSQCPQGPIYFSITCSFLHFMQEEAGSF